MWRKGQTPWNKGKRKRYIKRICQICGKEFEIKISDLKYGRGKFCSLRCYGIWKSKNRTGKNNPSYRGGKIRKECEICGKEFFIIQERDRRGKAKFCSKKCKAIWMRRKPSIKVKVNCLVCKKEFWVFPYKIKNGRGKFCSRKCAGVYIVSKMKKKDTKIERLIEDELIKRNMPYTKQVPLLGITVVDFLLPHDIVIYCDGDYWHNLPEYKQRDANQDLMLSFNGYKVYRFWEHDILKSSNKCINKILKGC